MDDVEIRLKSWAVRQNLDGVLGVESHMRNIGVSAIHEGLPIGYLKASLLRARDLFQDLGQEGVQSMFDDDSGNPEFAEIFELVYGETPYDIESLLASNAWSAVFDRSITQVSNSAQHPLFFNFIYVESIDVEHEHRGNGLGARLLARLTHYAEIAPLVILKAHPFKRDYEHLKEINANRALEKLRGFYARRGFSQIEGSLYMVARTGALKNRQLLVS